ncbi:hypothetical protein [Roseateles sp.]|uniref:hypothetical protein n=1 Tax=Roseateles sp. TaxID=1971397 RepID=UPI003D0A62C4
MNILFRSLFICLCALSFNGAQSETTSNVVIPEFEKIIADAKKTGVDPIDFAYEKNLPESKIFELDKYLNNKLAKEANERKVAEAQLDKEAAEREVRIAQKKKELADKADTLIRIFSSLKKDGKFTQKEVDILTRMYNNEVTPPETKKLIEERFPDLFPLK